MIQWPFVTLNISSNLKRDDLRIKYGVNPIKGPEYEFIFESTDQFDVIISVMIAVIHFVLL